MMTDSCYEKLILAMLSQKSRMCRPRLVALPRSSKVSNIWIASLETPEILCRDFIIVKQMNFERTFTNYHFLKVSG